MPDDQRSQIAALLAAGHSQATIAEVVGVSVATVCRRARKIATPRRRRLPITAEERTAIKQLHREGSSIREIARVLKRSFAAVKQVLQDTRATLRTADPWRCSCGNLVRTDRCLICEANAYASQTPAA